MKRLNPPKKRSRQQPIRKGQAAQYNRDLALLEIQEKERKASEERQKAAEKFMQSVNTAQTAAEQQASETPFTGQEYQEAAESQRQEKVQKWHDINTGFEAALTAQLGTDLAIPFIKGGLKWLKNKAASPAARILMDPENFVFNGPAIKPAKLNIAEEPIASEQLPLNLSQSILNVRPKRSLPSPQQSVAVSNPPEATYDGKTPTRILNLQELQKKNNAIKTLQDIADDPNDYTFQEINQVLQGAFKDEGTVPIKIDSSGEVIHLGNNTQEELKKVNAVLERYGYEKIPEGLDDVATRQAVLDRAAQHRTFGRGVYLKPKGSQKDKELTKQAARNFGVDEKDVTAEMKLQTAATHTIAGNAENGRQGLGEALHHYGLSSKKYDAVYTSNRDQVMAGYSVPGYGSGSKGKAYVVQLPVNDTPNTSLTQLWENNEFPIMDDFNGTLTDWRIRELPYMLKTGKPLAVDVEKEAASIDPEWIKATMEAGELAKKGIRMPIKYSDTKPTERFIQKTYDINGFRGDPRPSTIEGQLTSIVQQMMKRGVKPINPLRSYKMGPRRFEVGDVEVMDPSYEDPVIEEMTLKYPWAFENLNSNMNAISEVETQLSSKGPLPFDMSPNWRALSKLRSFGAISNKQYEAIKKVYHFGGDASKYIDFKKATQKAKDQYFKDIKLSHSRDAWHRKLQVAKDEKRYQLELEDVDRATGRQIANLMFKNQQEVADEVNKAFQVSGAKPNYNLTSKDGYRVFTTEGIRNPDPNDQFGQHFVVVGPKDTKMLDLVGEYVPQSGRKHHGHGGNIVNGFSRNLGSVLSPLFLGGGAAYNYYKDDKK